MLSSIDDLRLLLVDLQADQASDIAIQHKLRECLQKHSPSKDDFGVRVPVVASIREGNQVKYVRLGHQFCVRDAEEAALTLKEKSFKAAFSESLLA